MLRCHGGSSVQGTAKPGRRRTLNHGLDADLTESVRVPYEPRQGLLRAVGFGNLVDAGQDARHSAVHRIVRSAVTDGRSLPRGSVRTERLIPSTSNCDSMRWIVSRKSAPRLSTYLACWSLALPRSSIPWRLRYVFVSSETTMPDSPSRMSSFMGPWSPTQH